MVGRRRLPLAPAAALLFAALAAAPGCSRQDRPAGPPPAVATPAGDQLRELRQRVDELERQDAEANARHAEELAAMRRDVDDLRAALDQADRQLAALSGAPGAGLPAGPTADAEAATPARQSAHAALRERLRHMYDASREAVERLSRSLDRSLERTRGDRPPARDE